MPAQPRSPPPESSSRGPDSPHRSPLEATEDEFVQVYAGDDTDDLENVDEIVVLTASEPVEYQFANTTLPTLAINEALLNDPENLETSIPPPSTDPQIPSASPPLYKSTYRLNRSCSGNILSWMFDDYLNVVAIKREDGMQYFRKLSTGYRFLRRSDLRHLARLKIVKRGPPGWASWLECTLKNESYNDKWKTFVPVTGNVIKSRRRRHPLTGNPWVRIEYPPVQSLIRVPLPKYPSNFLRGAAWWAYDPITTEAVVYTLHGTVLTTFFDPMSVVNLTAEDQQILHTRPFVYTNPSDRPNALPFPQVVRVCVTHGVHAGSPLPPNWT